MKLHYFIGDFNLQESEIKCLDTEIIHQIKDVLKLKNEEMIVLCDGSGSAAKCKILSVSKKEIVFAVIEFISWKDQSAEKKEKRKITLYAALLKKDSYEWLLQKAVEVGVDEIVPVISERTVKVGINVQRFEKIIKEAAEQSERWFLPKLLSPVTLKSALENKNNNLLFFDPTGSSIGSVKLTKDSISLFIGPEGGWSEAELNLAKNSKGQIINLGDNILRGETAGIVVTYLAKNIF